jgi:hypothetical protein
VGAGVVGSTGGKYVGFGVSASFKTFTAAVGLGAGLVGYVSCFAGAG